MRPDEHKAKESRRYQNKKKKDGDTTAAEIAEARRRKARANDKGTSIAAIRRRNGEILTPAPSSTASTITAPPPLKAGQFSKRKITSNQDRYKERSLQDEIEQDAELGIDRETTDLVTMLDEAEGHMTGGSTYFKFKEEQILSDEDRDKTYQSLLQVDFNALEKKCQQTETRILLGLSVKDADIVECAFEQDYIGLDKPLIPVMNKTSQGVIMLKPLAQQQQAPQQETKADGIYVRNDRSTRAAQPMTPKQPQSSLQPAKKDKSEQELDVLLGIESSSSSHQEKDTKALMTHHAVESQAVKAPKLKVPGSTLPKMNKHSKSTDDQAWLDDLLG